MKITKTNSIVISALLTSILCLTAPASIPMGAIPFTLTTFFIMLFSLVFPLKLSVSAICLYIFCGICGIPVFSGYTGGISVITGPTGGYIWSYIIMCIVINLFPAVARQKENIRPIPALFGCITGMVICYACGILQYMIITGNDFFGAVIVCVLPFLPLDICKITMATLWGAKLYKKLNKQLKA